MSKVILPVPDIDHAVIFYSELLEEQGFRNTEGQHIFEKGGYTLVCVTPDTLKEEDVFLPGKFTITTSDISRMHRLALDMLCREVDERIREESGRAFFNITDPFGNSIELVKEVTKVAA